MYSETLLEHFRKPRNGGELPPPSCRVEVSNPACGDVLILWVRFEGDRASAVRYQARGCTALVAAGSALTVLLEGMTRQEMAAVGAGEIEAALGGLPAESMHAAALCAAAVRALLR